MPIGKNALKRVSNNGYSGVNTSAPDMENSEVVEPKVEPTELKTEAKPTPEKTVKKSAPKKSATPKEKKPATTKSTENKPKEKTEKVETSKEETTHPDGFVKVSFGMDMPVHLL